MRLLYNRLRFVHRKEGSARSPAIGNRQPLRTRATSCLEISANLATLCAVSCDSSHTFTHIKELRLRRADPSVRAHSTISLCKYYGTHEDHTHGHGCSQTSCPSSPRPKQRPLWA